MRGRSKSNLTSWVAKCISQWGGSTIDHLKRRPLFRVQPRASNKRTNDSTKVSRCSKWTNSWKKNNTKDTTAYCQTKICQPKTHRCNQPTVKQELLLLQIALQFETSDTFNKRTWKQWKHITIWRCFRKEHGPLWLSSLSKKHCQQTFFHSQISRQPVLSLSNPSRLSQVLVLCKFSWGDVKHLERSRISVFDSIAGFLKRKQWSTSPYYGLVFKVGFVSPGSGWPVII